MPISSSILSSSMAIVRFGAYPRQARRGGNQERPSSGETWRSTAALAFYGSLASRDQSRSMRCEHRTLALRHFFRRGKDSGVDDIDNLTVTTADELATHYARPLERVLRKELDHVDALGRAFIAASPFLVLATSGNAGLDCSPKGDEPGFVQVEDDGRALLIPDRRGNNRLDGLKNIVEDPRIGLIFFIPGANETYRVNGRARISADALLRHRLAVNGKEPATVIVVAVEQAFPHCPKALVRSDLWRAAGTGRPNGAPTLGDFAAARNPGTDAAAYDAEYARRMPGELY
jgi:PPOX class probable FMN-dependent enzyme